MSRITHSESSRFTSPDEQNIGKMFNNIAPYYDFLNGLLSLRQDARWRRHLISQTPPVPGCRLLDVATGTGDVLAEAIKQRPYYSSFTGCDIAQHMLKLADRKLVHASKVQLKQLSAESIELPDQSEDCITISFGLRNVVNKQRAIREFYRVLKPGGTLLILEFFQPEQSFLAKAFLFYFRNILPRVAGLMSDRAAYTYLPESVEKFYTAKDLMKLLKTEKFSGLQEKRFLFGATRIIRAQKPLHHT